MIPITKPYFGPEEGEAARHAVESGWVSQGPKVAEFERVVADYLRATPGGVEKLLQRTQKVNWTTAGGQPTPPTL